MAVSIYIHTKSAQGFHFPHILSSIVCRFFFFMIVILTGVRCYFIVVLICISLIIRVVEHLSMCFLAMYLFWRNLYLCLPLIFLLGVCFIDTELHELFILEMNPLSVALFANIELSILDYALQSSPEQINKIM